MKYLVEIGTINAQNRYVVKARTPQSASRQAMKKHKECGRNIDGQRVWVTMIGR